MADWHQPNDKPERDHSDTLFLAAVCVFLTVLFLIVSSILDGSLGAWLLTLRLPAWW